MEFPGSRVKGVCSRGLVKKPTCCITDRNSKQPAPLSLNELARYVSARVGKRSGQPIFRQSTGQVQSDLFAYHATDGRFQRHILDP
jgi:hypothetical protein